MDIAKQLPSSLLVQTACIWEATARKVGNVHPNAEFQKTSYVDFLLSAAAIAPLWDREDQSVGSIVLEAVRQTQQCVRSNTNLGIILLLAPFRMVQQPAKIREQIRLTLGGLRDSDAKLVYQAIREANPGGLGKVDAQDVSEEPTISLIEAMQLAADRDLVARQYASGYADVFEFGLPHLLEGFSQFGCVEAAIINCQLRILAEFPDSLILRKKGAACAEDFRTRAAEIIRLGGIATIEGRRASVALDRLSRSDGNKLNPGSTADLVTACLLAALMENKLAPATPFKWTVLDWL